jgi:arylsulfatase A-like enzyme
MDTGIGNITAALKAQTESSVVDDSGKMTTTSTWDNTLFILFGDNGGDCGLPSQANGPGGKPVKGQPGMASNYPLLGRKCTAYDGGTRVAAIVSGGLIPPARRGTVSNQVSMFCFVVVETPAFSD